MKIAIVNTMSPFVWGGAEMALDELIKKLNERKGLEVSSFRIPFSSDFQNDLIKTICACKSMHFEEYDMLISPKFPSYCIPHRNKVIWLFHQLRQVYELWDTPYGFKNNSPNRLLKKFVIETDNSAFSEAKKIFCLSSEVASRLKKYNSLAAPVMASPLKDSERFFLDGYGDFIFYPSRCNIFKRQHLAIEAFLHTKTKVKLIIAGKSDNVEYQNRLESLIGHHGLESRVKLIGQITQEEKFKRFSECLAVLFIPYKEDYGLVTLEAGLSSKAVITASDSGGVLEYVTDSVNGKVVEPSPEQLAAAFDLLYDDRVLSKRLGSEGKKMIDDLNLNWDQLIDRLLE